MSLLWQTKFLPETIAAVNANPLATQTRVTLADFTAKPLLQPVFAPGHTADVPTDVFAIQKYTRETLAALPEATQRLVNPDFYPVYLTPKLAEMQQKLIAVHHGN